MIKIESLSPTAIVTVEGYRILEGQLITREEYATIVVEAGSVTVSIDEKELVTINAVDKLPPGPEASTDPTTLSDDMDFLYKVVEPEITTVESETIAAEPEVKVKPRAKSVSAKTTKTA